MPQLQKPEEVPEFDVSSDTPIQGIVVASEVNADHVDYAPNEDACGSLPIKT